MAIKPVVGRKVWYKPQANERTFAHDQAFDATIAHVHNDTLVNLTVRNDLGGTIIGKTNIVLADSYDHALPGQAGWAPHQINQIKIDEVLMHAGKVLEHAGKVLSVSGTDTCN